jgi:TusA-related sulfurtransferase
MLQSPLNAAERFLAALMSQDFDVLESTLKPYIKFRALTPDRAVSATESATTARYFRDWFGLFSGLECLEHREGLLADRLLFDYRLRLHKPPRAFLVEQKICCTFHGGLIEEMDLICSGFHQEPIQARDGSIHRFEAGELGCGSGLPREFRSQIAGIPVGHILEICTSDPSAREDLPSMARLLGHTVHSVRAGEGETNIICVERVK